MKQAYLIKPIFRIIPVTDYENFINANNEIQKLNFVIND